MAEKLHVVRNQKDTVFRMLFREKKELLELYNALNDSAYNSPEDLTICTLENAIYMNFKNDISFLLDSEMNLYEHQGSYNPNMPLRDLVYIAKQLEKYTRDETIYSSTLVKIPVPRFVVFYNGTDGQPERQILRLSDAFEKETSEPELELKVLMLNINFGHNKELMEKCRTLREYSQYVDRVRKYAKRMRIEEAVERAVTECIREGILADFLSSQRAEVIAVSIFEYNEEEEMRKIRASEYKNGKEDGIAQGIKQGIEQGIEQGMVETCKELGVSFEQTVARLKLRLGISEQEAQEKVRHYW
ncbi:RpnC/YadD family protein [Eisenbergiella massiliensis]|uniref:Transposase n=1 Tax=Eisenbergiella massiliensis TaxID=1720294 RepID=A0A3E3I1P5_9FIRM|nr:hypothetical protein [Eisenbergiella massiliensis]RGE58496.1 hypothetical protein DXC51_16455 [Eisenbergiella massiliensis]